MAMDVKQMLSGSGTSSAVVKLASLLFHSRTQIHILHLQTNSYAQHMALGDYYEGIIDLVDRLVESAQGRLKMVLTGYTTKPLQDKIDALTYFNTLLTEVESLREGLKYPFLEQVCDEIIELISSTLYKLAQLK